MFATRKILTVAFALLCMAGLVWFVVTFRWTCLAGLIVIFTLPFVPLGSPPRPKGGRQFTRILTIQEAEAENMEVHTSSGPTPVPFGSVNRQWRELLAMRQNGDVLWELYSNEEWVAGRVGQAGVALIRDGKVVGLILSAPRRGRVTAGGCRGFRGRRYICANRPDERSEIAERDGTRESCGMNPYHDKALGESESAIGPVERILRNSQHPLHFLLSKRKECEWKTKW